MIYLFTWNSQFLIDRKIASWKKVFLEKYGDFNLIHIRDIDAVSLDFLSENLLSWAFLWDKKMIIIEDFFKKAKKDNEDDTKENDANTLNFLLDIFPKIPEETIVVLTSTSILKTSKIYKYLKDFWKIEEFSIKDDIDLKKHLENIYSWLVDNKAMDLLISYKASDIYKIVSEIDKLLIVNDFVSRELVEKYVRAELEQNIFPLLDDFLNLNKKWFFDKLEIILQRNSYFQFYWSFLSNLRLYPFIYKLKSDFYSSKKIIDELQLWNRWFLVDKNYKVSKTKIIEVYNNLVNLDLKMKSGEFVWINEEDFRFEFEKVVFNYFD